MTTEPNRRRARLYVDSYEVDLRLSQLGISRGVCTEAALQGDLHRRWCTHDDPPSAAGFYAIEDNAAKLDLVYNEDAGIDFWYLLVDASNKGIWAEVSHPTEIDEDGCASGWAERIILGHIDPGDETRKKLQTPDEDRSVDAPASNDIDIPVTRKSA